MHVDLPREAHAAEHLGRGLAVRDRGVAGHDLGAVDEPVRSCPRRPPRRAPRPRCTPRPARPRCASSMSASMCLIAWNPPIGRSNCTRSFAYVDGELGQAVGQPELERGGERRCPRASRCGGRRRARSPRGSSSVNATGVHGSSGHGERSASIRAGSTKSLPPFLPDRSTTSTSSASRCSIQIGGLVDDHARDPAVAEEQRRDERARNAEAAELFEHDDAVGPREPVVAQREHARPRRARRTSRGRTRSRTRSIGTRAASIDAMPSRSATWSSERSRSITAAPGAGRAHARR